MRSEFQPLKCASVLTNGCPENRLDAASMKELLLSNGWTISSDIAQADLIIFNACGLTDSNEFKSLNSIRDLQKKKKNGARLIVCGCLPKINPASLSKLYDDITFGSDNIEYFSRLINADQSKNYPCAHHLIPSTSSGFGVETIIHRFNEIYNPYALWYHLRLKKRYLKYWKKMNAVSLNTYFIKIATGCVNNCAYCAVKLSRGNIRSKSIENILREVQEGLNEGWSDIALLATDSGSYGIDRGVTLVDLLREIIAMPGDFKIRLRNVHPGFLIRMSSELAPLFKTGKIVHMTSAIQSGNNRILKLMKRNYTVESCYDALDILKKACPSLQVRSQIIVGFPGETENEFQDSVNAIDKGVFDFVEAYAFSPRINTPAANLANRLSTIVVQNRHYRLVKKILEKLEAKKAH